MHESGEADGVLFGAMRFVQGGDLGQVLPQEGPLPPFRAAEFLSPMASALDAAHGGVTRIYLASYRLHRRIRK